MTGVEILTSSEIITDTTFNPTSGLYLAGFAILLFILGGLFSNTIYYDFSYMAIFTVCGIIFGVFIYISVGVGDGIPTEYETHYKVTISDEVSMNDFLERYEIIDQEGKIYTVRERDGVEDDK
jgi:hypothetical protein